MSEKRKDAKSTLDDITSSLVATADLSMTSLYLFGTAVYMLEYTEVTVQLRLLDVEKIYAKKTP